MERLTIDEVIAHCQRTCEKTEMFAIAQGKTQDDITSNQYWEHYQVCNWLEELKHYKNLEEQGLLVKLPCKVGDTIYAKIGTDAYINLEVIDFGYHNSCGFYIVCGYYDTPKCAMPLSDFGKNFFLKNPQAEQAIKEMEESHGEN